MDRSISEEKEEEETETDVSPSILNHDSNHKFLWKFSNKLVDWLLQQRQVLNFSFFFFFFFPILFPLIFFFF